MTGGGARPGAGAKRNAEKNGPVNQQYNLHRHFNIPMQQAPTAPVPTVQVQPTTPVIQPPTEPVPPELEWQRGEVNQQNVMDAGAATVIDAPPPTKTKKKKGKTGQNKRTGLLKECMSSIDAKYHKEAIKKVQNGNLWDNPSVVLHGKQGIDMRKSWKEFHKMSVFNWFPFELIPGFKPNCGTCGSGDCMKKDGLNNPPRLVFGEHENYILNAPQRLCCAHCKDMAKIQADTGIATEDRSQYNWLTTDDCILEQIACEYPHVSEEFPCYLSSCAGLDKDLLDNIVDNAVKGIGPGAMSETIERKHAAHWQSREIKWIGHLRTRRDQPTPTDERNIPADQVEKCPEYKSDEMGGVTPSPPYLIHMFCRETERLRKCLDADCIKRLATSGVLSIDASYKVSHVDDK